MTRLKGKFIEKGSDLKCRIKTDPKLKLIKKNEMRTKEVSKMISEGRLGAENMILKKALPHQMKKMVKKTNKLSSTFSGYIFKLIWHKSLRPELRI